MVTSKKRGKPLTKDEIFERALAIVDADGIAALTMRRLASEVGVEAASLYHHVPNKDALLDGIVVRMRSEVRIPDPLPDDWEEMMILLFGEYRRVLAAHPNLVPLSGRRVDSEQEDSGLVYLTRMGLDAERAVELWQSLLAFVVGYSMFSTAQAQSDVSDLPPGLAARMAEWRDETCARSLRILIDGYAEAG